MEKGKINLITLIILLIVILILGIILGYVVIGNSKHNDTKEIPEMVEERKTIGNLENMLNNIDVVESENVEPQTLKFNEEKTINVDEKLYRVGIINTVADGKDASEKVLYSKIYVNNKFVKTYIVTLDPTRGLDLSESRISLKTIKGTDDKTYLIIEYIAKGDIYSDTYLCVVNSDCEFVGSIKAVNEAEGISTIDNQKGSRYTINEDSITIYKRFHAANKSNITYGAVKEIITLYRNEIVTGYERIYVEPDEVTLAGK